MPRVLLLHTNREYAETLADAVATHVPEFEATAVSRVPVGERLSALATGSYDLVQVDELLVNGFMAGLVTAVRGVPLVTAIRGWADYTNAHGQYGRLKAATIRARTRFACRRSAAMICISETAWEEFIRHYAVDDAVVINRPIDVARYAGGTDAGRDTMDLLTVTNLRYEEKYRGVVMLLRALAPLFSRHPDLRLRVAGGGRHLETLREWLGGYEHADSVALLGHVDRIEDEFASADAFAYVSYLDSYATVVPEAQAAGLPVVVGDASGVPDAAGSAGVVCEPTPTALRDEFERLLASDAYRQRLATRSRERMATYNERCARAHSDLWRRVLDDRL